ncbi:MAG TPA: hypothetical protein VE010_18185 [Thermoanaerobaculia bacterium]|nr:hypothetical protein [Thermoanaerobaculia bacterium]
MSRTARQILLVAIVGFAGACDVSACSCLVIGDPVEDPVAVASNYDAVFRGRVVASVMFLVDRNGDVMSADDQRSGSIQRLVVLRVDETFRGNVLPLVTIATGAGGGDCGYPFEENGEYIVFAEHLSRPRMKTAPAGPPMLATSSCSFTTPLKKGAKLLESLREALPPRTTAWITW